MKRQGKKAPSLGTAMPKRPDGLRRNRPKDDTLDVGKTGVRDKDPGRDAPLGHAALVRMAERWLTRQGCGIVFRDSFAPPVPTGEIPDAIGWRHTLSILVECKTSRADFLADSCKPFRAWPGKGMGDWRFMLCEPGLLGIGEMPDGWGLLYATPTGVKAVHGMPSGGRWGLNKPFSGNKACEMEMMYAALRRFAVRGHLSQVYLPAGVSRDMDRPPEEMQ